MKTDKVENKIFVAIGSDGKRYKIIESTKMLLDSSFGTEKYIPDIKWYSLSVGTKLNPVGGGEYEIMGTEVRVSF